ncbi:MAG TPA: site-specific DNA-methyltransferase [Terriglobales bacterium]|nr:site-specific DNA-methyltransferase [Terriglobales bacterium]
MTASTTANSIHVSSTIAGHDEFIPRELRNLSNPQTDLPRIAKDRSLTALIDAAAAHIPTVHDLHLADARRRIAELPSDSVHLVVTSPPYWTLKEYRKSEGQLGFVADYDRFLLELDKVWRECWRALIPGGRLIVVVGDVCLSRRSSGGRHMVMPLHASIQEHCRAIGFDNLAPILWYKIANAKHEVENGSAGFLGKPYEPNAVVKNDVEYILMERKPGAYRKPSVNTRILSLISADNHQKWFQQIWSDVTGASTKHHPAPFPLEIAERLVRMFSFVGDTVLDPFLGTGTTSVAAATWGRNSIGIEVDEHYFDIAVTRLSNSTNRLFSAVQVNTHLRGRTSSSKKRATAV